MPSKKDFCLKTKRMTLRPVSDDEIAALIDKTEDEALRQAYCEMQSCARNDADNRIWYVPWVMERKGEVLDGKAKKAMEAARARRTERLSRT